MTAWRRSPSWPATTPTAPVSSRTPRRPSPRPASRSSRRIIYAEDAQTFDAEIEAVKAANPEGVLLISFDEASKILTTMVEQGVGPQDLQVYGVDGFMGNAIGENFDAGE